MPMAKLSVFAHSKISDEIRERKKAGETPKPTIESVVDEMVKIRISSPPKKSKKNIDLGTPVN